MKRTCSNQGKKKIKIWTQIWLWKENQAIERCAHLLASNGFNAVDAVEFCDKRVLISINMLIVAGKHPDQHLREPDSMAEVSKLEHQQLQLSSCS